MARATLSILSRDEIERIHGASIRILDEIGVALNSESVSKLLEGVGCIPSEKGDRMLIPEAVVKSALASAPKESVLLASRDKKHDIVIPSSDKIYMANGGEGVYVKNLLTGERHTSSSKDVIDFTVLGEEIPQVDFLWTMVGAIDQPPHIKEIAELLISFEYSGKHYMGGGLSAEQAKVMIELMTILSGGRKELERRPIGSAIECPIPPLGFDEGLIEAQVEFAKAMIPVVAMSAPIAGLTSPVTLSGTVAQVTAENLASLVVSQAARKGAPFVFSSDSSPADMRTGSIDYGGMEAPLLHASCGQMGRFYGLPTMVAGASIAEAAATIGTIQEGLSMMTQDAMMPSDLGSAFGGIDNALGASLESMVVDTWIWDLARELGRKFDTDDASISIETIREAATGSPFLTRRHTIQRFKKEIISSSRPEASQAARDKIEERGTLLKQARAEVERILKAPKESKMTKDEKRETDAVLARERKALKV
jgi:trimethylamine--corrinoid protein Co-methyltransferase